MHYLLTTREKIEVREKDSVEGGQAVVFFPPSHPGSVLKIFKKPLSPLDTEKLTIMIANPPADPCRVDGHSSFAWPQAFVFDAGMRPAGYLMPRIQRSATVLDVFNPHRRKLLKLQLDWRFLLGVAANLASVTASLHDKSYVLGDINEGNVLVNNRALVTLIDVDSFQVEAGGRLFPCPVGKEEYTPREVLEQGFTGRRSPCADDFGLAVMIFQLLLEGSHPFRGVWSGHGDPPPIAQKIRLGHFPYAAGSPNRPISGLRPRFGDLPEGLQQAFYQAFIDGHADPTARPTAADWQRLLRAALKELRACPANPAHQYFSHSGTCPWCFRKQAAPPARPYQARPAAAQPQASTPKGQPAANLAPRPAAEIPSPAPKSKVPRKPRASRAAKTTPPPAGQPLLSKAVLDFGERFMGDGRGAWRKLTLTNSTPRPLSIALTSPEPWVAFSEERFLLLPGQQKDVRVKLLPAKMPARAGAFSATAAARIDPGTLFQVVRLKGALVAPDLALTRDTCVFTAAYRYQKMAQEVGVRSRGKTTVTLTASTKEKWISVSPEKASLKPGESQIFRVVVDPTALPQKAAAGLHIGRVRLKGRGGYTKEILVALRLG